MKQKKIIFFLLITISVFVFFLPRFINLNKRIGFDWDQEKISHEVKEIAVNKNLTLIGPRANNDKGFFLGPHLAYLLIPYYVASNFSPDALMYFVISYCIVFFFTSLLFLKKISNIQTSVIFLLLWSLNISMIDADIGPVWPILIPLGVILTWFLLYLIFKYKKSLFWFLLGVIQGFFFNMHFQFIFIILFTCIFILISKKSIHITWKHILFFLTGIILMFLPLIIFDLRHQFFNLKLFISFFTQTDPNVGHWAGAWIPVFSNIAYTFLFIKTDFFTGEFLYLIILTILLYQIRNKILFKRYFYLSSLVLWIIFPIFFALYGKRPSEYYFVFLYPFIIFSLTDFFLTKRLYLPLLFFIGLYAILSIMFFYPKLTRFGLNYYQKNKAVKRMAEVLKGRKCDIAFNVPLGREVGYRYLFEYYGIKTIGNWKSCVININIPPRNGDEKFDYIGINFPKELQK